MPGPVSTSTTFAYDVIGRYVCNTLDEARASQDRSVHPDARPFDTIVLGGGSFGAVVATHLFDRDVSHRKRILVLEAGPLALPEHVQNLPSDLNPPGKGSPGTIWGQPWESDSPNGLNRNFPGLAFCLGGRSLFWGGWSPYFIESELADPSWPESLKRDLTQRVLPPEQPVESYLDQAARQLGTDTTNDFVYGPLHQALRQRLFEALNARRANGTVLAGNRGRLTRPEDLEAPLAIQSAPSRPGTFPLNKFSGVQLLIRAARVAEAEAIRAAPFDFAAADAKKRLMIVDNIYATRLVRDARRILRVETSQGGIDVPPGGKVVLALGTIENTRMALVTVPEKKLIGRNLMAHLRSNLTFRIPHDSFRRLALTKELAVSALFVKGIHKRENGSKGHFHLQITATGVGELGMNSEAELFRKIPNIDELDQFKGLNDRWIVVTVRGIGEMLGDKTSADPQNRIALGEPDGNGVPRARVRLETDPKDASDPRGNADNELWDAMDGAAEEVARALGGGGPIQYLSLPNDTGNAVWQGDPPRRPDRRDSLASTHHEGGTLWTGDRPDSSVTDDTGRIWETDNLYVVGPAVLPTLGSPNPMLTGVALGRRTADKMLPEPELPRTEAGFETLFDGTERTFQRWQAAGPGSFALVDGALVAQPGKLGDVDGIRVPVGDQTVLFYAAETFDDFVLRLQFRMSGTAARSGKPVDNSGVFLRFHAPHGRGGDLPTNADPALKEQVTVNPAWVATHTGFEVQIDENAEPDGADRHRTGAIYAIPTGAGGLQTFQAATVSASDWNDMEITVKKHRYTVSVNGRKTADFTNPRNDAVIDGPGLPLRLRGSTSREDALSGHVGLQAHTGNVAFRNVRIKRG